MRWRDIGHQSCSVARALSVVGERWTILLLREAFLRTRRFDDFVERTGAPRPIVSDRLRQLVDAGVLEKRATIGGRADRFEYRLTDKGIDLWPVVMGLLRWGDRWGWDEVGEATARPLVLRHRGCGEEMVPELACPSCGEWLDPREVTSETRPLPPNYVQDASL